MMDLLQQSSKKNCLRTEERNFIKHNSLTNYTPEVEVRAYFGGDTTGEELGANLGGEKMLEFWTEAATTR